MNKLVRTVLVSAGFLTATATALAQAPANLEPRPGYGPGQRAEARAFSRPTERVEARLAYVKTALKITDAQQSQWDAYAAVVRKNAQDREQWINAKRASASERAQHPNAIERLERAQSFHAEMVTRINQLIAVEKPLYAALSPEQQKVADVVLNARMRRGERPGMQDRGGFGRG